MTKKPTEYVPSKPKSDKPTPIKTAVLPDEASNLDQAITKAVELQVASKLSDMQKRLDDMKLSLAKSKEKETVLQESLNNSLNPEVPAEIKTLRENTVEFRVNAPNSRYITKSGGEIVFRASAERVGMNPDGSTVERIYGHYVTANKKLIKELTVVASNTSSMTIHKFS